MINKDGEDEYDNLKLLLEKDGHQGFLRIPLESASKGEVNKMCCCASSFPHNESQKFIIMGSEEAQMTPIFELRDRQDGMVTEDLPLDLKNLPNWLRKESTWLFDRNIDIHQVVEFLLSKKRML